MCAQAQLFSCIPCLVQYNTREEQTAHLRSDLHGYNLKRRVAELPPVSAEDYARKRQLVEESAQLRGTADESHRMPKSKEGHRQKKRAVNAATLVGTSVQSPASSTPDTLTCGADADLPPKRVDRTPEYKATYSFFDNHVAESLEANLAYMNQKYALTIPDAKYVVDMPSFIDYLGRKLFEGHQCLECNKPAKSLDAVRQHMFDRGHRHIGTHLEEHMEEYQDFYDYSSSYKELLLPSDAIAALDDALADDGDDDWEVVEEYEDVGAGDEGELRLVQIAKPQPPMKKAEKSWDEQLAAVGIKRAYLNHDRNLILPAKGLAISNRKNLVHGRPMVDPRGGHHSKRPSRVPVGMLTATAHDAQVRVAAKRDGIKIRRKLQRSEMRLGVKSNTLYRYIARKNKIFI